MNKKYTPLTIGNIFKILKKQEPPPLSHSNEKLNLHKIHHLQYNRNNPIKIFPERITHNPTNITPPIKTIEDPNLGFILTRHVNSKKTNLYWIECIKQIKKFYPLSKIVIIDDNSDPQFLDDTNVDIENCHIIQSEFKKRGEILPYYYFYKYYFFEKAVIIHDSVFIQSSVDFSNINNIKFLWTFEAKYTHNYLIERLILSKLKNNAELLELYSNKKSWNGCFGVMSVITYDFVKLLNDKYNLFSIISIIDSRMKRCCVERIFGTVCHHALLSLGNNEQNPIFGNINDCIPHNKYSFPDYLKDKTFKKFPKNVEFVKIFSGR